MNTNLTPEQKKQRTELLVKIGGLLGVCLILGPLATTLAAGGAALLGLIIGGAAVFTAWKFLPWFALKVGNWHLKALKAEATKSPIESLQSQLIEKRKALDTFKENIRIFAAQVLSFSDQVKQYVKDGLEDAQTYVDQLAKMKQLLEFRQRKYQESQEFLKEFEETIQRTDRKWKMACAAAAMNEAAGQVEGDVFDKIVKETALESVQQKLNQSFADLEIALMDDDKNKISEMDRKLIMNTEASTLDNLRSAPVRQRIVE